MYIVSCVVSWSYTRSKVNCWVEYSPMRALGGGTKVPFLRTRIFKLYCRYDGRQRAHAPLCLVVSSPCCQVLRNRQSPVVVHLDGGLVYLPAVNLSFERRTHADDDCARWDLCLTYAMRRVSQGAIWTLQPEQTNRTEAIDHL